MVNQSLQIFRNLKGVASLGSHRGGGEQSLEPAPDAMQTEQLDPPHKLTQIAPDDPTDFSRFAQQSAPTEEIELESPLRLLDVFFGPQPQTALPDSESHGGVAGNLRALLSNFAGPAVEVGSALANLGGLRSGKARRGAAAAESADDAALRERRFASSHAVRGAQTAAPEEPREKPARKRQLEESESLSSCMIENKRVEGDEDLLMRAASVLECQTLCQNNDQCVFCSFDKREQLCYHYSSVISFSDAPSSVSVSRNCGIGAQQLAAEQYAEERPKALRTARSGESEARSAEGVAPMLGGGLLGNLLGSLGGSTGLLGGGAGLLGGGGPNLLQTLQAASNILTTGSQLLNNIPVKELGQVSKMLSENPRVAARKKNASGERTGPPAVNGKPTVACNNIGMTCCIPRIHDWQKQVPYLNGYKENRHCQAVYVSAHDSLCVTSVYNSKHDVERCGVMVRETEDIILYRNTLTVPQRDINNAICDCFRQKGEAAKESMVGNARWEYRLSAEPEEKDASGKRQGGARSSKEKHGKSAGFENFMSMLDGRRPKATNSLSEITNAIGNLLGSG